MENKMTNKEMFGAVKAILEKTEGVDTAVVDKFNDFVDVQLAKLERNAEERAKKVQESHAAISELITKANVSGTATEIFNAIKNEYATVKKEEDKDLSVQKVTSVLKSMLGAGKVTKAVNGKKSTYSLV